MKIGNFFPEEKYNIAVSIVEPSKWHDDNYNQIARRAIGAVGECITHNDFSIGPDFYVVGDFTQSMFYNRDSIARRVVDSDIRGLLAINFSHDFNPSKIGIDILLPKHGVGIIAKASSKTLTETTINRDLKEFTVRNIIDIILENGGDLNRLTRAKNDLFYNGKKFFGSEILSTPEGYFECSIITCKYLPEKEWFDKLNHCKYNITGITEEIPIITKNLIINELITRITKLVSNL